MVPPQIVPEQWYDLVDYWKTKKVEDIAIHNARSRSFHYINHTTGRTSFTQIRRKMVAEGLPTDKMSVWKYTRNQTGPDVRQTMDEFERQLSMLPEDYRTTEDARDSVFHDVVGEDGHGYCRTYGKDVPWSMVYGDKSKSSQSGSQSSIVAEITKQVRTELRQELRDEI
ncbi:uncharacterized protein LOC114259788 isoform X3 [Camellia sinensis]|uniref:uncharacterized protein LOC114259788 isoform X3 n=1 Tax=Camellia sinensis TaxID=4442 RepID=UPI0010363A8A|nr:uncharacterized protein LOC114259788 isoform X3 [Camellia sinensis]